MRVTSTLDWIFSPITTVAPSKCSSPRSRRTVPSVASATIRLTPGNSAERSCIRSSLQSMPRTSWPKESRVLTMEAPTRPIPITANCLLKASSYRYVLLRVSVASILLPGRERQDQGYRPDAPQEHHAGDEQFTEGRELRCDVKGE